MEEKEWEKKAKETLREAGKKGGHKAGEEVAGKVPRIREENIERGAYPAGKPGREQRPPVTVPGGIKKGEMTLRQAGHRGGEAVAEKVRRIREENQERGARPQKGK